MVNKITDSSNNKVYFPFLGFEDLKSMGCTTYEKANVNYNHSLSDMESSGFFYAASKYTLKEFINIIKIVSDNEKSSINFKNKNEIYNLIIDKKEKILSLCNFVEKVSLAFEGDSLEKINFEFEKKFKNIKFTFTQTQQMKSLLKLYFSKHKTLRRNLFDQKKNGAYNLELFKKFLKL